MTPSMSIPARLKDQTISNLIETCSEDGLLSVTVIVHGVQKVNVSFNHQCQAYHEFVVADLQTVHDGLYVSS